MDMIEMPGLKEGQLFRWKIALNRNIKKEKTEVKKKRKKKRGKNKKIKKKDSTDLSAGKNGDQIETSGDGQLGDDDPQKLEEQVNDQEDGSPV